MYALIKSEEVAKSLDMKTIIENNKGYGNAYKKGFKNLPENTDIIVTCDADGTYGTENLDKILDEIIENNKDFINYGIDLNIPFKVYAPTGCGECNNTGYDGRIGIFEAIHNSDEIEKAIINNPSEREIKKTAEYQGYLNMEEDGIFKKYVVKL